MNEFKLNQYVTTTTTGTITTETINTNNTYIIPNLTLGYVLNSNYTNHFSMGHVIQTHFIFNKEYAESMIKDSIKYLLKNSTSVEEIKSKIDKIIDEEIILDVLEE